jgi:phosphomannomutase
MIPWLLVAELISTTGKPLSEMVGERIARYPASGEINRRVSDADKAIESIREEYAPNALAVDETDGVSIEFDDWRFNLRASNTEPVIRLNVEGRGNENLMRARTQELLSKLDEYAMGPESL